MRYKLRYFTKMDKTILQEIDELEIKYNEKNTHILEFAETQPETQTIIIYLEKEEDLLLFIKNKEYEKLQGKDRFKVSLSPELFHYNDFMETLQQYQINYYIDIAALTWAHINLLIKKKVSDILIAGAIGLEIKDVAERLHALNIKVRAVPNCIYNEDDNSHHLLPTFTSFFIRPEDVFQYEPYVDVLEFPHVDLTKAIIFYKVYKEDKKWYGNLQEIVEGLNEEFNSKYIVPAFAKVRLNCKRSCFKNGKCQVCYKVKELAENLKKVGIVLSNKEEEEENG